MMNKTSAMHSVDFRTGTVLRKEGGDRDYYTGCRIESGHVCGLSAVQTVCQLGTVTFKDSDGLQCRLEIQAEHECPIPDGWYTLIGSDGATGYKNWVVGRLRDDSKFEKLSVIRLFYQP